MKKKIKMFESTISNRNLTSDEKRTERHKIEFVEKNWRNIKRISNPSLEVQLAAVNQYQGELAIQYIKNPGLEVQLAAVKQNGMAIRYIKNPSLEVQLAAVKQNSMAIRFIQNPSERVQIAAVQQNINAIRYIKNLEIFDSPEFKTTVFKILLSDLKSGEPIGHILDYLDKKVDLPELKKIRAVVYRTPIKESLDPKGVDPDQMSEEEQIAYVQSWAMAGMWLKYIQNPSERVQLAAVQNMPFSISYISNPSERVQMAAITQDVRSVGSIRNPNVKVQLTAIRSDGSQLDIIRRLNPIIFNDEQAKKSILRALLTYLKENNLNKLSSKLEVLRHHQVNWPELYTIESAMFRK